MKNTILMLAIVLSGTFASAQKEEIREVINTFAKAGDKNDADKLAACLDDNYRVVMNRLFGSNEVMIMPKDAFVEKIRSKEFGGDDRDVTISDIVVSGTTASAKVRYKGKKMTSVSLVTLIQNPSGDWKMVNETPIIE